MPAFFHSWPQSVTNREPLDMPIPTIGVFESTGVVATTSECSRQGGPGRGLPEAEATVDVPALDRQSARCSTWTRSHSPPPIKPVEYGHRLDLLREGGAAVQTPWKKKTTPRGLLGDVRDNVEALEARVLELDRRRDRTARRHDRRDQRRGQRGHALGRGGGEGEGHGRGPEGASVNPGPPRSCACVSKCPVLWLPWLCRAAQRARYRRVGQRREHRGEHGGHGEHDPDVRRRRRCPPSARARPWPASRSG